MKLDAFSIIPPSIRPIRWRFSVSFLWLASLMYSQSLAKSRDESVSPASPSQSVSLLKKCAS